MEEIRNNRDAVNALNLLSRDIGRLDRPFFFYDREREREEYEFDRPVDFVG